MSVLNEVKINVKSLLISSQKPLSIEELEKDYINQMGECLPYKLCGFNTIFELLQNMKDILIVPPNPNRYSTLTLIVGEKTSHLRELIDKQKPCTKKKKNSQGSTFKRSSNNFMIHKNKTYFENNYNKNQQNFTQNNSNYRNDTHQNKNNRCDSQSFKTYQRNEKSTLNNREQSDFNKNNWNQRNKNGLNKSNWKQRNQNEFNSTSGYVTENLQLYLKECVSKSQTPISKNVLINLVKNHPDISMLKVYSEQDLIDKVERFLDVNQTEVGLKNIPQCELNILHSDSPKSSLKMFSVDESTSLQKNQNYSMNNSNACVNNYTSYENRFSDKKMLYDLYENLSIDEEQNNISCANNIKETSKMYCPEYDSSEFVGNRTSKNNETAQKNIDSLKKVMINQPKKIETKIFHENKSMNCLNNFAFNNSQESFSHSTPIQNNNVTIDNIDKIFSHKNQTIPIEELAKVIRIFNIYNKGVNIENYELIYRKIYHSACDPNNYGFTSLIKMLESLDDIVETQNNILYSKSTFENSEFNKNISLKHHDVLKLQQPIHSLENVHVSLYVKQKIFSSSSSKIEMKLAKLYNPSLFYLLEAGSIDELNRLMRIWKDYYDTKNNNYYIDSHYIIAGCFYITRQTTFPNTLKQWFRIKVLRFIDLTTVEVIYVDNGTIGQISKTELRFLRKEFCDLPCQAIHCCLNGYNELDTISLEVTEAFSEFIVDKTIFAQIDDSFIFNDQLQILHVTLYGSESNDLKSLINLNDQLTIWHLNQYQKD